MDWRSYWSILRRRWVLIAAVVALDVLLSGYLFAKSYRQRTYQGCVTMYVADVSSPSLIAAAPTTLQQAGQLLAGETAANFFGDDILDVAQSRNVTAYVSRQLGLPSGSLDGAVSGARRDRTVDLCISNANSATALSGATTLGRAMSTGRARFVGAQMAKRTYVAVVSPASVSRASARSLLFDFALRFVLGLLVALGLGLLWDALDPNVRDERDLEEATGVPVLATLS